MAFLGERLALTLWVGALWSIGYLAVPLLQEKLPAPVAAGLAEQLYSAVAYLGLACGLFLLLTQIARARPWWGNWRLWLVAVMWGLTAAGEFLLGEAATGIYLAVSLMGLALVGFGLQPEQGGAQGFPAIKVDKH